MTTFYRHPRKPISEIKTCPKCGEEMTFEPADPNYGADADGNRGWYVPASWRCEACGEQDDFDRTDIEPDYDPPCD